MTHNPSSTAMSDDFEIREPTAKHPSPSEGLKRFATPMSDEQSGELREAVADLPFDGKGLIHSLAANMEPEYFDALLDWIAHHTKEAVEGSALKRTFNRLEIIEHR